MHTPHRGTGRVTFRTRLCVSIHHYHDVVATRHLSDRLTQSTHVFQKRFSKIQLTAAPGSKRKSKPHSPLFFVSVHHSQDVLSLFLAVPKYGGDGMRNLRLHR